MRTIHKGALSSVLTKDGSTHIILAYVYKTRLPTQAST